MKPSSLPNPADVTAAARIEDLLAAARLAEGSLPPVRRSDERDDASLHIVYLLPRTSPGEGARVLLEHANHLAALGAKITVVSHFPHPSWFPLRPTFERVPFGEPVEEAIPPCDVIVAGYWEFVLPARNLAIAPVIHFEQGDFHLYDDVPAHVLSVIEASLRAAHATIAVGDAAISALAVRYGVDAVAVPHGVDVATFRRPPDLARPPSPTVLFVGWDGHAYKGFEEARRLARLLGRLRPGVRIVWATPSPPVGEPFGELVVAAAQAELARCYQQADVFVCCSRFESFALSPLEAMAAGTPVVSTANPGVLAYARDTENVLLAEIGDIEGLAESVERILDDPALAAGLARRGLETAEACSWPRVASGLLGFYRETLRDHDRAAPLGPFSVNLEGVSFERLEDRLAFDVRLASCATRELAIPVSQPAVSGHRVFRWRVVARRADGAEGTTRAYLPARSSQPVEDSNYQVGLELLRRRRPEEALELFVAECQHAARNEQAVLGRWIVLSLLAASRADDAADVAVAFARDFPSHPDYLYLGVVACLAARRPVEVAGPLEAIRLLGHGARHEEWFDDPAGLLSAHLAAA